MKIQPAEWPGNVVVQMNDQGPARLSLPVAAPFKLKSILVPVDFSDGSTRALEYAVLFAKQFSAQLVLLHVLPFQYAMGWDLNAVNFEPLIEEGLRKAVERRLNALVREVVPAGAGAPAKTEVRHGATAMEIVNVAKELGVDLIVLSAQGHTNRSHALIGGVAAAVTRLAPCPVLAVRECQRDFVANEGNPFKTCEALPDVAAT